MVITHHGTDQPNFVRIWRGSRYLTCRCTDCGQNFYAEAGGEPADDAVLDDRIVDDEEALRAAEDELKKEADDEGDHRIKGL